MNQDKIDAYNEEQKLAADEQAERDFQRQNSDSISSTIALATKALIDFQSTHQAKVSVTNQKDYPTSIKTPDVQGVIDALASIKEILSKPEEDDTRELEAINVLNESIKGLSTTIEFPEIPEPLEEVTVKNQPDYKPDFKELNKTLKSIDVKPVVNVPEDKPDDYTPIIESLTSVVEAIGKIPKPAKVDLTDLISATNAVQQSINNLVFPVANYVLPFKDSSGKAIQANLDSYGNLQQTQYAAFQFDPDDSAPIYIGKNIDPAALDADLTWTIYKFTYSGSNVTKIIKKVGDWTDRVTLFS